MKKSNILSVVLAIIAIAAIIFGIVTNGKKVDLQKQIDDLKANVATLTTSLDAAKKEAADAVKNAEDEIAKIKEEAEKAIEEAKNAIAAPAALMTHDEYVAAEVDSEVIVETYVQAKQGWWENNGVGNASVYTQAEDGAYFLYNMPMSKEEFDQLVSGTKIRVKGYKSEWSGEVEITEATFEILESDPFIAEALDVTALLGTDELAAHQNELVAFKGMTVEAKKDANGNDVAFLYNWDGSGQAGNNNDLYFDVSVNGATYTFTVESYLCGQDTDVYKAVEALNVGDVVDLEGFLYWYNGANPHITSVKAAQ